jgi:hypothetical protein
MTTTNRSGALTSTSRLPLAMAVAAAGLALTACSTAQAGDSKASTSRPSSAATATRGGGTTYSSGIGHYTVHYPSGWTLSRATTLWKVGAEVRATDADRFRPTAGGPEELWIASQPLPAGMTVAQWYAQYLPDPKSVTKPECWGSPDTWQGYAVDGQEGGLFGRAFWCNFTEVIIIKDRRAYVVHATPNRLAVTSDVFSQSVFDQFTAGMRLTG